MESSGNTHGTIITFYSYKGGTGRSMMLANIAWLLACRSYRVLVIDWDLEAPGLHRYFLPFLNDKDLTSSNGVIDFIIDFAIKASENRESAGPANNEEWWGPYTNILRYASSLQSTFPNKGALDFVSAGRQSASYSTRVNSFNWQTFYDVLGGGLFLEAVKTRMRREYDYILIDSRTGLSDTAGICTVQMPDILVSCFTLNSQSIEGASTVARAIFDQRQGTNFCIFPVPTRTDNAELEKRLLRLEYAQDMFDAVLNHIPETQRNEYWGEVEVPYVPFYSYEEMLASFRDSSTHRGSLLAPFERLTGYLTNDFAPTPIATDEGQRVSVLNQFANETSINYDVFLAYAQENAEFAEQLARRLRREKVRGRKLRVFTTLSATTPLENSNRKNLSALNRSGNVVVIVTPEWWGSPERGMFDAAFSLLDPAVIPVYQHDAEIPRQFRFTRFVDFRTTNEFPSAVEKLLEILRDPSAVETLPTFGQDISAQLLSPVPDIGFVSRHDRDGTNLVDLLKRDLSVEPPSAVVLWGAGGVGKTTLAAETMRAFDSTGNRRVVWFSVHNGMDACESNTGDNGYSNLLDGILAKLDQTNTRTLEDSQRLSQLRSVASTNAALLVLDGFERLSSSSQMRIERDLIGSPPCPLLITTRRRISSARHVLLSGFSLEEFNNCVDRWLRLRGDKPELSARVRKRIYNLTEGIPLALQLVLGYFNSQEDYRKAIDALDISQGPTVERALKVAFNAIADDRYARSTLFALALFSPSGSEDAISEVTGFQRTRRVALALLRLKNLGLVEESDNTRFTLHDAVSAYVHKQLIESKNIEPLQQRFVNYFLRYVSKRSEGTSANYEALELERDNILNAINRATTTKNWSAVVRFGQDLVLKDKWLVSRGNLDHAIRVAELALTAARESGKAEDIVAFANAAAGIRIDRSEYAKAADIYDRASVILEELQEPGGQSIVLHRLGQLHTALQNYSQASKYYSQSLGLSRANPEASASTLASVSELERLQGNYPSALDYLQQALNIAERTSDPATVGKYLQGAGNLAIRTGKLEAAEEYFLQSLRIYKHLQMDKDAAQSLSWLGTISLRHRDFEKARQFYNEALEIFRKTNAVYEMASCFQGLGRIAQAEGKMQKAVRLYRESLEIRESIGDQRGIAYTLYDLGTAAQALGESTDARQFYTESLETLQRLGDDDRVAATLSRLGRIHENDNNLTEALTSYKEAVQILERIASPRAKTVQARLRSLEKKNKSPSQSSQAEA